MSQYRKTIVAEFFFKAHSPVLEMILFWKQTSSQLLKFADIFGTSFLQEHAPVSSFSEHDKPITRERNVIHFGGYFIYGGHFMNRQCQASDMQVRKCKNNLSVNQNKYISLPNNKNISIVITVFSMNLTINCHINLKSCYVHLYNPTTYCSNLVTKAFAENEIQVILKS